MVGRKNNETKNKSKEDVAISILLPEKLERLTYNLSNGRQSSKQNYFFNCRQLTDLVVRVEGTSPRGHEFEYSHGIWKML